MASTKMIVFHLKEWFYTTGNGFEQDEFQQKEQFQLQALVSIETNGFQQKEWLPLKVMASRKGVAATVSEKNEFVWLILMTPTKVNFNLQRKLFK